MASTNWTQIEVVSISDIHLGNAANPAEFVIAGLEKMLTFEYLSTVNLLFIVGDVFDRGLPVNHRDVPFIVSWIRRLLARCARTGTSVIVVEGTPSHDRLQSQLFVAINDAAEEEDRCKLRYVKEVSIVHVEEYGINVLCIPDEKNTSDAVTYKQVITMMQAQALEQVDFALIHGFFDFQVPVGRHSRFHISDDYRPLVRHLIFVGHDHEHQQSETIIIQGSPDRQRHGMESPKGFVRARVFRDGTFRAKFEVNENAMVFRTLHLSGDLDADRRLIYSTCDTHSRRSHIRLACRRDNAFLSALDKLRMEYPFIVFSKKDLDEDKSSNQETILATEQEERSAFTIDSSNLKQIISERMSIKQMSEDELRYFDELIQSVL